MNPTTLLAIAAPQVMLAGGVVVVMGMGFSERKDLQPAFRKIAFAAVAAAGAFVGRSGVAGPLGLDGWTAAWHLLFVAGGLMLLALVRADDETPYALVVGSVLGMSLLASSRSLIGLFLGLELMSLPAYLLVYSLRRGPASLEAATKYFFMGSAAASVFLLGVAAAFGATGSLDLAPLGVGIGSFGAGMGALAVALMGAAALFKIGAFPFHFWLPDVYEAAAPELAGFLSTSMKAAGLLLLLRLLSVAAPGSAFVALLPACAALTMTVGNVMAWRQKSLTRLLAYSSIAHAGYLLLGVVAWHDLGRIPEGVSAVYVYLLGYLATNFGLFAIIGRTRLYAVDDLRGLARRSPWAAGFIAVFLLSLAGVPPTAGFLGKLLVFWDAVLAGRIALVVVAVLNSLVGLGYYVRLVRLMYLEAPHPDPLPASRGETDLVSFGDRLLLWVCAVPALILGLVPWVADWARYILVK